MLPAIYSLPGQQHVANVYFAQEMFNFYYHTCLLISIQNTFVEFNIFLNQKIYFLFHI